jgi:NADH:ubiquinone oxidoreductase subunit H
MVEINRSPIDLFDGESESVSGFNVEYFRMEYALIFLADYADNNHLFLLRYFIFVY